MLPRRPDYHRPETLPRRGLLPENHPPTRMGPQGYAVAGPVIEPEMPAARHLRRRTVSSLTTSLAVGLSLMRSTMSWWRRQILPWEGLAPGRFQSSPPRVEVPVDGHPVERVHVHVHYHYNGTHHTHPHSHGLRREHVHNVMPGHRWPPATTTAPSAGRSILTTPQVVLTKGSSGEVPSRQ